MTSHKETRHVETLTNPAFLPQYQSDLDLEDSE